MHLKCCVLDCMIRRQRSQLVRELWRLRQHSTITAEGTPDPGSWSSNRSCPATAVSAPSIELRFKSALNSILKRLDVDDLELLLLAVRRSASASDQCIVLPQHKARESNSTHSHSAGDDPSLDESYPAHWLVCRMFRWQDLSLNDQLRALPACTHEDCINPLHWYRVVDTGTVVFPLANPFHSFMRQRETSI